VLFGGRDVMAERFADAIRTAPPEATTAGCLATALESAAAAFTPDRHDLAGQRRAVIAAHSELQERELLKQARPGSAMPTPCAHAEPTTRPRAWPLRDLSTPPSEVSHSCPAGHPLLRVRRREWQGLRWGADRGSAA
jgi:hypothetical protein